ncbi:hypothetical protein MMC27_006867 [Xylographa pallens]|nr:hypothetical protein [Xylographa pallens]
MGTVSELADQIQSTRPPTSGTAMTTYAIEDAKWRRSWKNYLPFSPYGNRTATEEAFKYFEDLNAIFYTTSDIVKRLEAALTCLLPRIAIYEAGVNGTTNASLSVMEFDVGVRRYEEVWVKPYEGQWAMPTAAIGCDHETRIEATATAAADEPGPA